MNQTSASVCSNLVKSSLPIVLGFAAFPSISCTPADAASNGLCFVDYKESGAFRVRIPEGWKIVDGAEGIRISNPSGDCFAWNGFLARTQTNHSTRDFICDAIQH